MSDWTNSAAIQNINDSHEAKMAKMMADSREESRRQDEAHLARLEADRLRQQQELEKIKEDQRLREAERMRRMEEDRLRRIEAQKEQERRMAAESHARVGLLQSMKTFIDSRLGRNQTVHIEEIRDPYPQLMPPTGPQQGGNPPQQGFGPQRQYPPANQQQNQGQFPPYNRNQGNNGGQGYNNGF